MISNDTVKQQHVEFTQLIAFYIHTSMHCKNRKIFIVPEKMVHRFNEKTLLPKCGVCVKARLEYLCSGIIVGSPAGVLSCDE